MAVRHAYDFGTGSGEPIMDTIGTQNGTMYSGCNRTVIDGRTIIYTPAGGDSNINAFTIPKEAFGEEFAAKIIFYVGESTNFTTMCTHHNGVYWAGMRLIASGIAEPIRFCYGEYLNDDQTTEANSGVPFVKRKWFEVLFGIKQGRLFISVDNEDIFWSPKQLNRIVHNQFACSGSGHVSFVVGNSYSMYFDTLIVADSIEDLGREPMAVRKQSFDVPVSVLMSTFPASLTRGFR